MTGWERSSDYVYSAMTETPVRHAGENTQSSYFGW